MAIITDDFYKSHKIAENFVLICVSAVELGLLLQKQTNMQKQIYYPQNFLEYDRVKFNTTIKAEKVSRVIFQCVLCFCSGEDTYKLTETLMQLSSKGPQMYHIVQNETSQAWGI